MQPNPNDPVNRTQAPSTGQVSSAGTTVEPNTLKAGAIVSSQPREGFLTGSFLWMFVGVLLSAMTAAFVMNNPRLLLQISDMWLLLIIGQFALVFGITFLITRISSILALGLFFVFALTMGLTLGVIVFQTVGLNGMQGVVSAFAGAAAIFGGAAIYGYVTKRDLTSLGGILFMGLLGLIVVMFLQIFLFSDSSTMSIIIGIFGVAIFTGLTAWDVQRLKNGAIPNINKDSATVMGALMLYLDFINLFLFMLRISGGGR